MAGNTFGQAFKVTTFGESHGPAIGVVIDGVPPNVSIKEEDIQYDLDRRHSDQPDNGGLRRYEECGPHPERGPAG